MTWFRAQMPVTYENYKLARQSDPTRQDTKKYHTKVKNHFSICKTASCPCCCKKLDRYPAFEDNLEALANQALDKNKQESGLGRHPSTTKLAGKTNSIFQAMKYAAKKLPIGTAPNVVQYFRNRSVIHLPRRG
jgi:hypothetical protein